MTLRLTILKLAFWLVVGQLVLIAITSAYLFWSSRAQLEDAQRVALNGFVERERSQLIGNLILEDDQLIRAWLERLVGETNADFVQITAPSRLGEVLRLGNESSVNGIEINIPIEYGGDRLGVLTVRKAFNVDVSGFIRNYSPILIGQLILSFLVLLSFYRMISIRIIEPILTVANRVGRGERDLSGGQRDLPREIIEIYDAYTLMFKELDISRRKQIQAERDEIRFQLMRGIAHDMNVVIATLENAARNFDRSVGELRALIGKSTYELRQTIDKVLSAPKERQDNGERGWSLEELVQEVWRDLDCAFGDRPHAKLSVSGSDGIMVFVPRISIKRVLLNILKNAREAESPERRLVVTVNVGVQDGIVMLSVTDNGVGIGEGKGGSGVGKPKGYGIGLGSSQQILNDLGGSLQISSFELVGCEVRIEFPLKCQSLTFNSLVVPNSGSLVVLDDDPIILDSWKHKVLTAGSQAKVLYFSEPDTFRQWYQVSEKSELNGARFYFDHDLGVGLENGLDIIWDLGLAARATLVTGRGSEPEIVERAMAMGVPVVSKS